MWRCAWPSAASGPLTSSPGRCGAALTRPSHETLTSSEERNCSARACLQRRDPEENHPDCEHGEVVRGALFIARCDAAELFQAVDQALDPIAKPVGGAIETRLAALVALAWNDGSNATLPQTAPSRWAAVALVARHAARPEAGPAPPEAGDRTPVQDVRQSDLLVALAAGQNGRDGPTMAFGAQVDLG